MCSVMSCGPRIDAWLVTVAQVGRLLAEGPAPVVLAGGSRLRVAKNGLGWMPPGK